VDVDVDCDNCNPRIFFEVQSPKSGHTTSGFSGGHETLVTPNRSIICDIGLVLDTNGTSSSLADLTPKLDLPGRPHWA
jgi:hypothetical protein